MTRPVALVTLALSLLPASCNAPDASADAAPEAAAALDLARTDASQDVLGSLRAMVNGEPLEFYVVAGDIRGEPYASAAWFEPEAGRVMLAVGGLDTPEPPLESFERDASGMSVSFGDYTGPVLSVILAVPPDRQPFAVTFPSDDGTAVSFSPVATVDDLNAMFLMASGSLEVTSIGGSNGRMDTEGTFAGTVKSLGSGETIEITEGSFSVKGVPHVDEIMPRSP